MYCHQCGKEIEDGDKFCAYCGTAVPDEPINAPALEDADTEPLSVSPVADDEQTEVTVPERDESDGASETEAAEAPQAGPENSTEAAASSLKTAVESTRKRSRRKMPMILLVALALALASAVALAAYFVYTQVYLPSQQQEQEVVEEENPQWDEAVAAYQVIIDQYNEAISTYGSYEVNSEEIAAQYPYVNFEPMLTTSPEDAPWQYAYHDLNDDGVPEMLVGTPGGGRLADNIVFDIWSYQDGAILSVAQGIFRGNYSIRNDNLVMYYGNGGVKTNALTILRPTNSPFLDAKSSGTSDNFATVEGLASDWGPTDDTISYEITNADGLTESGTCTDEELSAMIDELIAKYPEDTNLEWHPLPTDGAAETNRNNTDGDPSNSNASNTDDENASASDSTSGASTSHASTTAKISTASHRPTVDAYNDVIDQYKETFKTAPGKEAANDYPLVNPSYLDLSAGSAKQIYFAEHDLNKDGTPELLVGDDSGYDRYGAIEIFDIWTYQDNELVQVTQGNRHHTYSIRTNNLVSMQGQDGTTMNGFSVGEPTSDAFTEWTDDASSDDENFMPIETLECNHGTFFDPKLAYIHTTPDGTTTSEECTGSEFSDMIDDLTAKYPEDPSIEWYSMSAA